MDPAEIGASVSELATESPGANRFWPSSLTGQHPGVSLAVERQVTCCRTGQLGTAALGKLSSAKILVGKLSDESEGFLPLSGTARTASAAEINFGAEGIFRGFRQHFSGPQGGGSAPVGGLAESALTP